MVITVINIPLIISPCRLRSALVLCQMWSMEGNTDSWLSWWKPNRCCVCVSVFTYVCVCVHALFVVRCVWFWMSRGITQLYSQGRLCCHNVFSTQLTLSKLLSKLSQKVFWRGHLFHLHGISYYALFWTNVRCAEIWLNNFSSSLISETQNKILCNCVRCPFHFLKSPPAN